MDNYKKSHYAINKVCEGIVYKNADGSILEITFEKIATDNPEFTKEDFAKLKELSDEIYHEETKNDYVYHYHFTTSFDENIMGRVSSSMGVEDKLIERYEREHNQDRFWKGVETLLTPVERRRFVMHYIDGLTTRQIAAVEGTSQTAIWKSIKSSTKKMKNFLK